MGEVFLWILVLVFCLSSGNDSSSTNILYAHWIKLKNTSTSHFSVPLNDDVHTQELLYACQLTWFPLNQLTVLYNVNAFTINRIENHTIIFISFKFNVVSLTNNLIIFLCCLLVYLVLSRLFVWLTESLQRYVYFVVRKTHQRYWMVFWF